MFYCMFYFTCDRSFTHIIAEFESNYPDVIFYFLDSIVLRQAITS